MFCYFPTNALNLFLSLRIDFECYWYDCRNWGLSELGVEDWILNNKTNDQLVYCRLLRFVKRLRCLFYWFQCRRYAPENLLPKDLSFIGDLSKLSNARQIIITTVNSLFSVATFLSIISRITLGQITYRFLYQRIGIQL